MNGPDEHTIFTRLRCQCGGCPRLPLSGCICRDAEIARTRIRDQLARGDSLDTITANYVAEFGAASLVVPPDQGAFRLIYGVPIAMSVAGLGVIGVAIRRWKRRDAAAVKARPTAKPSSERDEYDAKLDEELKKLDA
jgi:cytochrome c-type biogenesis protein CcmF